MSKAMTAVPCGRRLRLLLLRPGARLRRAGVALAALASAVLFAVACGGSPGAASTPGSHASSGGNVSTRSGQGSGSGAGQESSGSFTLAFAKCMRAHGVPNFPDPNGSSGQLGPNSGIDPNSPQFQSALNGRCQSLAPHAWVSSGKVSRSPGS